MRITVCWLDEELCLSRAGCILAAMTVVMWCVGPGDNVKCFCCDIALRNWRPTDSPWTEHARWSARCSYLRQKRDATFIANAQRQVSPVSHIRCFITYVLLYDCDSCFVNTKSFSPENSERLWLWTERDEVQEGCCSMYTYITLQCWANHRLKSINYHVQ